MKMLKCYVQKAARNEIKTLSTLVFERFTIFSKTKKINTRWYSKLSSNIIFRATELPLWFALTK
jgi:hypothetical protein